ncbi:MAG: hypothetical protein JWO96_227 [Candidatus Saccharibacteria bacterium]|nr:hypothetical protein [Candidatus Saccharibacteria bacterium]
MQPNDKLHTFVPVFNWSWWEVFLFTFVLGWVAIRIIKALEPLGWEKPLKRGGREIWRSGFYGDLFLPIGIASSIATLRNLAVNNQWYTGVWWNWTVFVLGFVVIIVLEYSGNYTRKQLRTPSKLWHTFIAFPIMFYLGLMSIIPLAIIHKPGWAVVLAIFGYGLWLLTYIHDIIWPPDHSKTH